MNEQLLSSPFSMKFKTKFLEVSLKP